MRISPDTSKRRALLRALRPYMDEGRDLPWRKTRDPYRILVSEIMLQQTQVERVIPFYSEFTRRFPGPRSLARAPLSSVLRLWQGLGYNRRAKLLHDASKIIVAKHDGKVSHSYDDLARLPGVGRYTARAVRVFAWNEPDILIETNVRAVFLHHFFPMTKRKVSDREIARHIEQCLDSDHARLWYSAVMDYGSELKRKVPNPSRRSTHHTKQKPFKGSDREVRGAIMRALTRSSLTKSSLTKLGFPLARIKAQLKALEREGLLEKRGGRFRLAR